jgi:hypothetical protein
MDDRELEVRLRAHLHHRFDGAAPSPELAASVGQVFATRPHRTVLGGLRLGSARFDWQAVAAAAVVAAIALLSLNIGHLGPAANPTQSVPPTQGSSERLFVVLPPDGGQPSKADTIQATNVLSARLRALGFGNFSSGGGFAITFELGPGSATDAAVRRVLTAPGVIAFIPLPVADYGQFGDGPNQAIIGEALPKAEATLFGWDGIASTSPAASETDRRIDVHLTPTAAAALAAFTTAHIGESFAIVIDGKVALVVQVMAPITSGQATLSVPTNDSGTIAAAILFGGAALPASWQGASASVIVSQDVAATSAERATGGQLRDASLSVEQAVAGGSLSVVWNVTIQVADCPALASCPYSPGDYLVTVNAVSGDVLHIGPSDATAP